MAVDIIDLSSLARQFASENRHSALVRKIRQVESVASAHEDLLIAKETLEELRLFTNSRLSGDKDPAKAGIIGGALFAHAIVLYSRATDTDPIDRWKWFGRSKLSKDLQASHTEVMEYRDRVLSHFGHGAGLTDGPAITHALVLRRVAPDSPQVQMTFLQSRASTRAKLSTKLVALTDACLKLARDCFDARLNELVPALEDAARGDRAVGHEARGHGFDLAAFTQHPGFDLDALPEGSHHWIKGVLPADRD